MAVTDQPLQINHANVEAVRLLSQGRAPEADLLLQDALKTDPRNVFTLNNMGVAKEMEGEDQEALKYYDEAARHALRRHRGGNGQTGAGEDVRSARWRRKAPKTLRDRLARDNDVARASGRVESARRFGRESQRPAHGRCRFSQGVRTRSQ